MAGNVPVGLLAELTYRCPLHCPYCSNPLDLASYREELSLQAWTRVLTEAHALGVLQLHLSGGEPLLRRDLPSIVATARQLGLYTNLITSAVSLTEGKLQELKAAGLDHVQISMQAAEPELADRIAGTASFHRKVAAARLVKTMGLPLTLNVVLHRHNIDGIAAILGIAEELRADRLELANTQYYGWALLNQDALLPTRDQIERTEVIVREARVRLEERMQIIYVVPDYYSRYPKPCMGGWASRQLTVMPNGEVWPCPIAARIAGLRSENVRDHDLAWIWHESETFNRFRGTDWMAEPCRSCARKTVDFGGCRCQAFLLTGDPAMADPVCHLSPHHSIVMQARQAATERANEPFDPWYRANDTHRAGRHTKKIFR